MRKKFFRACYAHRKSCRCAFLAVIMAVTVGIPNYFSKDGGVHGGEDDKVAQIISESIKKENKTVGIINKEFTLHVYNSEQGNWVKETVDEDNNPNSDAMDEKVNQSENYPVSGDFVEPGTDGNQDDYSGLITGIECLAAAAAPTLI